jgi:predicted nucleotidyltransferase
MAETLETLLGSGLRTRLLGWLFMHTDERYFVREIASRIHADSTNVSRELSRLEEAGILVSDTRGNHKYYQADAGSPIFNELKSIVRKTFGIADVIRQSLATRADKIRVAFIFGSIARSADNRNSDIDVMVIGSISFGDVVSLISPAEEKLGREVNPVVYPLSEFKQKVKSDHHFVNTVLEGEKIFLIGDESDLNRMAGSFAGQNA